jgi:hypothetical protein
MQRVSRLSSVPTSIERQASKGGARSQSGRLDDRQKSLGHIDKKQMITSITTLGVFALSLVLTAVSQADAGVEITSAPEKASAERATLRVHEIPREMSYPVLDRFSLVVPCEQMMYFAKTRKLVVYASPKIHNLVAERIEQDKDRSLREDSSSKQAAPGLNKDGKRTKPSAEKGQKGNTSRSEIKTLAMPRGPVEIVHLKGLDLLLIRVGH